ncbi:hypothetical protein OEZ86_010184 [Tetradesmus obliquus]|nr:hypothetical protein OEZ86_010184 [Tetradesmus obliquus]
MIRLSALVGQSHQFIHTFCDPEAFSGHFSGDLGAWTPCFIDVGLLGVGHLFACVCYTLWLHYISSSKPDRFRLSGSWPRALHYSCLVAAAAAAGIPLLQLNARLAEQALPLSQGAIAPHEWLGLLAAAASFLLLCAVLLAELQSSFVVSRRWLLRLPLLLVASSELVKLRFVVQQELAGGGPWGYFFWLYCAYAAAQVYLAAVLLLSHRDSKEPGLLLVQEGRAQYAPLPRSSGAAALLHDGAPVCPECTAGLWSRLTFGWLSPLIKRGYKTPLTEADLWSLPPADRVEVLEQRFHAAWQQQLAAHGPQKASLFAACRASVGHLFLGALPYKLINDAAQFVGPLILNRLLSVVATQAAAASSGGSSSSSSSGWWGALVDWLAALGFGDPLNNGYMLSLLMFVGTVLGVLADNQHFQRVMRAGFRLKAILTAEVYRKVLLLSPAERSRVTAGKLFNLVSSDTNTVGDFCTMAYGFLSAPLRIGLTMVLLYRQLGLSAIVAIVCIGAAVPVNSRIVRAAAGRLQQALRHTDTRAKLETELVAGIEVVKASTWEGPFYSRITAARALELSVLYSVTLLQSLMGVLVNAIPTIIPVMTFLAYLLIRREPLSAAQAFTALSLFNVLRFPLFQLPQIVTQATQAHVALGRLKDILSAAEVAPVNAQQQQQQPAAPAGTSSNTTDAATPEDELKPAAGDTNDDGSKQMQQQKQPAICIHGDFSWDPDKPPALTDLSLSIPQGTFVAVVGPTGSGKTSLIAAMLGLLMGVSEDDDTQQQQQQQQQQVQVYGSTAYVPQAPFILGGTVRENILFGRPWDAARYAAAVAGAQLEQDFTQLPGGDETELGDRGVNVSGGQKQRIAIARALYADADVVLMDDPLSALDARVGRAVAQGAIKRGLAGKTVVLATNQLQFVSLSDLVVVMRGGCAVEVGSYSQLLAAGGAFAALMKEAQAEDGEGLDSSSDTTSEPEQAEPAAPAEAAAAAAAAGATKGAPPPTAAAAGGKLTQDESSATGRVSAAVVWAYLSALGGIPAVLVLLGGFVGTELLRVGATVWLSVWTGQDPDAPQAHGSLFYMGVYAAISGAQLLVLQANYLCVAGYGIKAGRTMHEALLHSLLGAPMSFFHTTPTGRIINRLTKDTADIDRNLASNLAFALRAMLQLSSTVTLIAVGAPFSLPALLVMLGLFWGLYRYFIASMRQAKRLEAVSRSPVLSNVNEAIHGAATIRAFGITHWLIGRNMALVNRNAATSLLNQSLNRWLSVRLEGMGALCTLLAALVTVEQQSGSAATMGLLLTYALQITAATSMTLRVGSMAEQTFNAVERVQEYCQLPQELSKTDGSSNATAQRTATRSSSSSGADRGSGGGSGGSGSAASSDTGRKGLWGTGSKRAASSGLQEPLLPVASAGSAAAGAATSEFSASEGRIEFSDVNLRYRPGLPLVLRGLSFKVEPGWKVGVVGRTGAGKSSLIGALFRLTEIESGLITIDGVNTKALALRQLRCSMALIPQVPVLFTGSIRENLTPFGGHCDAALWSALRRAHLAPVVEQWEREGLGGLDYSLGEGGSPLSAGQKQLLALARALLNPAKILVLDEATANVDVETDALIQETLRQEFSDRTLLAVAHRLHTIIEADRVLVMQQGRAVEYGAPAALLKEEAGHFTSMVRETGEATEKFLRSMAAGDEEAHRELHDAAAAALDASLPGHGAADAMGMLTTSSSARAQAAARHAAAAAGGGSQFLRRLSLEVNPVSSHRRAAAAGFPGRASVDLAAGSTAANVAELRAAPTAPSSSSGAAAARPASGAADC